MHCRRHRVPAVRAAARPSHFRPRCRLPVLGPLSLSPPAFSSHKHHFAPAARSRASSSLRHPSYPLETTLNIFFVLRQKGAVFSACCAVSRALHLPKVLLAQLGFHRVHILSLLCRHRSRCVGYGRGPDTNNPCAGGVGSLRSPTPGGDSKDPALSCRRQPPRRVPPRNVSRLVTAYHLLLPGKQPPRPLRGHGSCRGTGGTGAIIQPSHADPSDNRRYVRVVRCASTARYAARPSG